MSLLVDTSVWSLALRRDQPGRLPEVDALKAALQAGEAVVTTGLVLQEILQGFAGPRDRAKCPTSSSVFAGFRSSKNSFPRAGTHFPAMQFKAGARL